MLKKLFSEDQMVIAELQVSGDGRRRREKIEIYYIIYMYFKVFLYLF